MTVVAAAFDAWCVEVSIQTPYIRLVGEAPPSTDRADAAAAAAAAASAAGTAPPPSGRTAIASVSLRPGDTIVAVPDAAVLTVEASRAGPALQAAGLGNAAGRAWREGVGLALALQSEAAAGPASAWAPYVAWLAASLPGLRATHPALWPATQRRRLLAGTAVGALLGRRGGRLTRHAPAGVAAAAALAAAFTSRHPALFTPAAPRTRMTFAEAYALVGAYSFTLGGDAIAALVPVWDALDHDGGVWDGGPGVALSHDPAAGRLTMTATRPVPPGGVVYNCYGDDLGPAECVRRYGWAPPPAAAPGERLEVRPGELGAAALAACCRSPSRRRPGVLKLAALAAASVGAGRRLCVDGETGEPSPGLVAAAAAAAGAVGGGGSRKAPAGALRVLAAVAAARSAALTRGGARAAEEGCSGATPPGRRALAGAVRAAEAGAARALGRWVRRAAAQGCGGSRHHAH